MTKVFLLPIAWNALIFNLQPIGMVMQYSKNAHGYATEFQFIIDGRPILPGRIINPGSLTANRKSDLYESRDGTMYKCPLVFGNVVSS
jgi:hypothetical protein